MITRQKFDVYVPVEDTPLRNELLAGSGIVGTPASAWFESEDEAVLIDFEGNKYGAVNLVTFADRVYHAAGRQQQRYPTVARRMVEADTIEHVGFFYPEFSRVDVGSSEQLAAIGKWLGLFDGDRFDSEQLHRELFCTHLRPVAA